MSRVLLGVRQYCFVFFLKHLQTNNSSRSNIESNMSFILSCESTTISPHLRHDPLPQVSSPCWQPPLPWAPTTVRIPILYNFLKKKHFYFFSLSLFFQHNTLPYLFSTLINLINMHSSQCLLWSILVIGSFDTHTKKKQNNKKQIITDQHVLFSPVFAIDYKWWRSSVLYFLRCCGRWEWFLLMLLMQL